MYKFLLALVVFAIPYYALAGIAFGPEIGLNVNTVYLAGNTNTSMMGPRAGITANIPFGSFALQTGALYSVKSGKTNNQSIFTTFNIQYLEIPVLFMYRPELGPGRIFINAGPDVAVAMHSSMELTAVNAGTSQSLINAPISGTSSVSQLYKKTDIAGFFSAGYEFSFGLTVRAFYSTSLAKYYDDKSSFIDNRTYGVSLAYLFNN